MRATWILILILTICDTPNYDSRIAKLLFAHSSVVDSLQQFLLGEKTISVSLSEDEIEDDNDPQFNDPLYPKQWYLVSDIFSKEITRE